MLVIRSSSEIKKVLDQSRSDGQTIGLVPTMGALHDGHKRLIRQSVGENDVTVVSIFVNPLQFNNPKDLSAYPRTLSRDLSILKDCGCQVAYCPSEQEMYPHQPLVKLSFGTLTTQLEGKFRPGHFDGVGLIVIKLFNQIMPDKAYFGLKDYQQYLLVKKIIQDFSYPIVLVGVPIVREDSGLALSSRNLKLSANGRDVASKIYAGLSMAKELIYHGIGINETKKQVLSFYSKQEGLSIEYLEVVDERLRIIKGDPPASPVVICVAAYVEGVRLIDNLYLQQD